MSLSYGEKVVAAVSHRDFVLIIGEHGGVVMAEFDEINRHMVYRSEGYLPSHSYNRPRPQEDQS